MIHVPQALVERANAVGVPVDAQVTLQTERLIESIERAIEQAEAFQNMLRLMQQWNFPVNGTQPAREAVETAIEKAYAAVTDADRDAAVQRLTAVLDRAENVSDQPSPEEIELWLREARGTQT